MTIAEAAECNANQYVGGYRIPERSVYVALRHRHQPDIVFFKVNMGTVTAIGMLKLVTDLWIT